MPDQMSAALKEMADRWATPAFEVEQIVRVADARRRHHRLALACLAVIVIAGGVTASLVFALQPTRSLVIRTAPGGPHGAPRHPMPTEATNLGPARPLTVLVTPLHAIGRTADGVPILASVSSRTSVTIRASVTFVRRARGTVSDAALLLTRPGTRVGVGGRGPESFYRGDIVAHGPRLNLTAPSGGVLSVVVPAHLLSGTYPVMTVYSSVTADNRDGLGGPYDVGGELGVVVIR